MGPSTGPRPASSMPSITPSFGLVFGGMLDTSIGPEPWTLGRDGRGPEQTAAMVAFVCRMSLHGLEDVRVVSNDNFLALSSLSSLSTSSFEFLLSLGQDTVMMSLSTCELCDRLHLINLISHRCSKSK